MPFPIKVQSLMLGLILILGFASPSKAQDASNDATWEETIEFLQTYQDIFSSTNGNYKDFAKFSNKQVTLTHTGTIPNRHIDEPYTKSVTIGNLNFLEKIEVKVHKNGSSGIILIFATGTVIEKSYYPTNLGDNEPLEFQGSKSLTELSLHFSKEASELRKRYEKALQHIIYLNKKDGKKSKF